MFKAREDPGEIKTPIKTLSKINDQYEENAERLRDLSLGLEKMYAEFDLIRADEQQLLADIEAAPDEADRAALQLKASSLRERRMQLEDEYSHARNRFEAVAAEAETVATRAHEEVEKLHSAGIETQKMLFETAKHLTTLNTAAILVYLAAAGSREVSLPLWVTLLFVLSLAGATVTMVDKGFRWISPTPSKIGTFGMAVAVAGFFVGLLYSVLHALLLP